MTTTTKPGVAAQALRDALAETRATMREHVGDVLTSITDAQLEAFAETLRSAGWTVLRPGEPLVTPSARITDPSTSHAAARDALPRAQSTAAALLLAYETTRARHYPPHGLTAEEASIAVDAPGAWRRVSDLVRLGLIGPAEHANGNTVTRPGSSGRLATVYRITRRGLDYAATLRAEAGQ